MRTKIEALFISDVHLGARGVNAEKLIEVLKEYDPEYLLVTKKKVLLATNIY
jgi:hypothetical protein